MSKSPLFLGSALSAPIRQMLLAGTSGLAFAMPLAAQQGQDTKEPAKGAVVELPAMLVIGRRTADGVPVVPIDSVGSRDVFGPEQVRETGARDINDLVQNLPAVSTRPYNGGEAAAPSFSMRGLPDDGLTEYIHLMIDGVPASPLPYGWTAPSFFPLTPERVYALDYIRGAHSVRYSPNTVGGVLNFITQPIPQKRTFEMRSTFGDFDYSSSQVTTGASTADGFGYLMTYVDRRGDGYRKDGGFDQQDFNLKLRQDLGDGEFVAGSFSYMEDEHKAPGGLTLSQFESDRFGNARPYNRFAGFRGVADLLWHKDLKDDAWFETFAWGSQTQRNLVAQRPHFPAPGDPLTISDWLDDSYVTGLGMRAGKSFHALGMDHEIFAGVRYQREWIPHWTTSSAPADGSAPATLTDEQEYTIEAYSVHIDDSISPTDDLTVTLGARFEWVPTAEGHRNSVGTAYEFDEDLSKVLPGVGASYKIREDWSIFANWFEGIRAPQVWGFGLTPDPANADIEFEEASSWELGTRIEPDNGLATKLVFWRNDYEDFLVFDSGFYENLGKTAAQGVDLVADWELGDAVHALDGFSMHGSITAQDIEVKSGPNAGNDVPYAWGQKAAWRTRYAFSETAGVSFGGHYVGDSYSDAANTVAENENGNIGRNPSRILWDAQARKDFHVGDAGSFNLIAGVTNLFDKEWALHSRGGFFGGGKVAGNPRQAYIGVGLRLSF